MLSRKNEDHENHTNQNTNWRNWWLVKHILSELPIIDGVCKYEKEKDIFYYSSRSTAALIIGTTVMMANFFDIQDSNPMMLKAVKMAAGMGVGMASGVIFHNGASFFINSVQNYCQTNKDERLLHELQSNSSL
ncbi:MAG: hypothetical protein LRY67_07095 [Gammaproteobacteria bacterium]|nr:hypothetical protein [Gammaproteobacteria bacterium]MCD8543003.1 hypothetical protein [Gammaproteobacteria bacterium]